jgi:hypothetical protein
MNVDQLNLSMKKLTAAYLHENSINFTTEYIKTCFAQCDLPGLNTYNLSLHFMHRRTSEINLNINKIYEVI